MVTPSLPPQQVSHLRLGSVGGIDQHSEQGPPGTHVGFQDLWSYLHIQVAGAREVAAGQFKLATKASLPDKRHRANDGSCGRGFGRKRGRHCTRGNQGLGPDRPPARAAYPYSSAQRYSIATFRPSTAGSSLFGMPPRGRGRDTHLRRRCSAIRSPASSAAAPAPSPAKSPPRRPEA